MCSFRSMIDTFPSHSIFVHPPKKFLAAIMISSHMEDKRSMYSLNSLKEKALSLCVNGWGRKAKKKMVRYLKANINFG